MPTFLTVRKDCIYCNAKASFDGLSVPSNKVFLACTVCDVPLCCISSRNCFLKWHEDDTIRNYVKTSSRFRKRKQQE